MYLAPHRRKLTMWIGNAKSKDRRFEKKLPGRMGGKRTTVRNLKIVQIDAENNLIYVKGAVPGATNGIVFISKG